MRVGITGTQNGWTERQRQQFTLMITEMDVTSFHHGDCVGVDEQAARFVKKRFGMNVLWCHPPDNPKKRAFVSGSTLFEEKPYLERNKDIAQFSEILFVIPKEWDEQIRSGTWYTYRQAKKMRRNIILILPTGEVRRE